MAEMTELDKLALENAKLANEYAKMQNEDLKAKLADRRAKDGVQKVTREQVQSDIADFQKRLKDSQEACNHRKGGKDLNGLKGNGSDPMYAVIHHQFTMGEVGVMCMRCQKLWMPKDPGYAEAARYPTDNTASGSCTFSVSYA